ncbi:hypothetical protein SteCoe_20506 [Stentor coeruleus]|uniref:DOMON domain-containing protein n=1 Tax=Stentor coeruleus TaxID=5963 RepID=A0A1R2BRM0_9CILI|nr:hypothetical protein SteCoe_20506 [Stentor coeruleus]
MWNKFLIALFAVSAMSCEVAFPNGIKVSYSVDNRKVTFDYAVPPSIYSAWSWVGFGMKRAEDGYSMISGDYVSIIIENGLIEDRTGGVRNGRPKTDDQVGGSDSLYSKAQATGPDGMMHFTWTRDFTTGDSLDLIIVPGNNYFFQWAVGEVANGVLKHHVDKGFAQIVFGICDGKSFLEVN